MGATQPAKDAAAAQSPPARQTVTDLRLYVLFAPPPAEASPTPADGPAEAAPERTYWHDREEVDNWALHTVAVPATVEEGRAVMPPVPLAEVAARLREMLAEAKAVERARHGHTPQVQYLIAHLVHLDPPVYPAAKDSAAPSARPGVRAVLDDFDPLRPNEPRAYFEHYERAADGSGGHHGALVVGMRAALVADLAPKTLFVLVSLLQSGALAHDGGFTRDGYAVALGRVTEWNANQDLREAVDELTVLKAGLRETARDLIELRTSGDAATRGQVGLSYAFAAIGGVLGLLPFVARPTTLAPGLVLFGLSGFAFALYAQSRWRYAYGVGWLLFSLGVLAVVVGIIVDASGLGAPTVIPV